MKTLSILLLAVLSLQLNAQTTFNDANAVKRSVSSFHGISASAGIQVFLVHGNEEGLAVSVSHPEMQDKVETKVENGILKIGRDNEWKFWNTVKNWKVKVPPTSC